MVRLFTGDSEWGGRSALKGHEIQAPGNGGCVSGLGSYYSSNPFHDDRHQEKPPGLAKASES